MADFLLEAADAAYDPEGDVHPPDFRKDRLVVLGIGGCFPETLTLRVTPAGNAAFEHIRVEFAKKRFWRLARANPEEIRVDRLGGAAAPGFSCREDGSGGCDGRYDPALLLPAGAKLRLAVGYKVFVDREETYRVVFRNFRGGKPSGAASMEVVFRNREPIDS
ncbi:MAG: hypothetical protein H6Q82_2450 [Deltaproteobacteria bacterium]|nr:hypothetical protein [Deltaproteobacteria bacterium]